MNDVTYTRYNGADGRVHRGEPEITKIVRRARKRLSVVVNILDPSLRRFSASGAVRASEGPVPPVSRADWQRVIDELNTVEEQIQVAWAIAVQCRNNAGEREAAREEARVRAAEAEEAS